MFTIETGTGFWTPLAWIIAFIIAFLVAYIIRMMGNKSHKTGTEQGKVFLSGNPEYDKDHMHIKASNLYWGFTKSLEGLYNILNKLHTGNASDYVLWFVVILAIFFIIEVI